MKTIHKYPVLRRSVFELELPRGHQVLSVQMQLGLPQIWVMVDTKLPVESYRFALVATGEDVEHYWKWTYVGTFQFQGGLTFHLFREPTEVSHGTS